MSMDNKYLVFAVWDDVEEKIIKTTHYFSHAASSVTQRVKHNLGRHNFMGLTREQVDKAYSRYEILVYVQASSRTIYKNGEWYVSKV